MFEGADAMINLNEIYKDHEIKGQDDRIQTIKVMDTFQCEAPLCDQEFTLETIEIAAFLYGIFYLLGENKGYVGITCPKCLKTLLMQGDRELFDLTKSRISSSPIIIGNVQYDIQLRYYSPCNYIPNENSVFKDYDIHPLFIERIEDEITEFESNLHHFIDEEPINREEFLCSYNFDGEHPIGPSVLVLWFRDGQIEDLVDIENKYKLRIIPRYFHKISIYEDIGHFCWSNYLYLRYLNDHKAGMEADLKYLQEFSKKEELIFDESTQEATINILASSIKRVSDEMEKNYYKISSDFRDIIVSDSSPFKFPELYDLSFEFLWRKINPFKDKGAPKGWIAIDPMQFAIPKRKPSHDELVREVKNYFNKGFGQSFINKHYVKFINEYIKLTQSSFFSYASVLKLKYNYLWLLHNDMRAEVLAESKYAFFYHAPTWTISFDGATISGLKAKGFKYIWFLVERKYKQFHTDELAPIEGDLQEESKLTYSDFDKFYQEWQSKSVEGKGKIDIRNKIDKMAKKDLTKYREGLKDDLKEAESMNDPDRINKARWLLESFEDELKKVIGLKGKERKFIDNSTRTKNRITKSVERALKEIKKNNEQIYKHFHDALKPINDFTQCYRPAQDIEWHLK